MTDFKTQLDILEAQIIALLQTIRQQRREEPLQTSAVTFSRAQKVVNEILGLDSYQVQPDSNFIYDLGADSLDLVELVMAFEEEFDIMISDEEAEQILTMRDVVEFIERKLN